MAASSSADAKERRLMTLISRLGESRFLTILVALHFLLILTLGGVVLVKPAVPRADFEAAGGNLVILSPTLAADSTQPPAQSTGTVISSQVAGAIPSASPSFPDPSPASAPANVRNVTVDTAPAADVPSAQPGGTPASPESNLGTARQKPGQKRRRE